MKFSFKPVYLFGPSRHTPELEDSINSFIKTWGKEHSIEKVDELFHYSSLNGVQGILEDRALWFGHITSFNDPLEMEYGKAIIRDELIQKMQMEDELELRGFLNTILVNINSFGHLIHHPFVVCFCESGELLSQWRAYAEKGGGYALGFKFSENTRLNSNLGDFFDGKIPILRKVIYDEEVQRFLVSEYIKLITETTKKVLNKKTKYEGQASIMAMQAVNPLWDMMTTFKHNAFKEEKEWRLIYVTRWDFQSQNLQFRKSNNNLIPYRSMYIYNETKNIKEKDLYAFPLTSLIFGPSLEVNRTRSTLKLYHQKLLGDSHPIKLEASLAIRGCGYTIREG